MKPALKEKTIDTEHTEHPVCPCCGHADENWRDVDSGKSECWDVWCPACDAEYSVSLYKEITFSTQKVKAKP